MPAATPQRTFRFLFLAVLAAYCTLCALLFSGFAFRLNPDATAYIGLARRIAAGDFSSAVNAYWGPLYIWMIAPLLHMGIVPLVAARLVQIVAGCIALYATQSLLRQAEVGIAGYVVGLCSLLLFLVWSTFAVFSPDLLLLALLLSFVALAGNPHRLHLVAFAGVVGGIGFLAKSVALPVVLLCSACFAILWKLEGASWKRVCAASATIVLVSVAVASPWIVLISREEGHFTIGTAGGFVHASNGPGLPGLPTEHAGLFEPAFEGAYSAWEQPTLLPYHRWSAFQSSSAFVHQMKLVFLHVFEALRVIGSFSLLAFAFLLYGVWVSVSKTATSCSMARRLLVLCIAVALPYIPILIDPRYFWPVAAVAAIFAGFAIEALRSHLSRWSLILCGGVFILSFAASPIEELTLSYADGRVFASQVQQLASEESLAGKRLAADVWKNGLYVAYWSDALFLGKPKSDESVARQLLTADVDFFLSWQGDSVQIPGYELREQTVLPGVRLWARSR